jgi:hypothetical protein
MIARRCRTRAGSITSGERGRCPGARGRTWGSSRRRRSPSPAPHPAASSEERQRVERRWPALPDGGLPWQPRGPVRGASRWSPDIGNRRSLRRGDCRRSGSIALPAGRTAWDRCDGCRRCGGHAKVDRSPPMRQAPKHRLRRIRSTAFLRYAGARKRASTVLCLPGPAMAATAAASKRRCSRR